MSKLSPEKKPDALLKDSEITPEEKDALIESIKVSYDTPNTEPKTTIDDMVDGLLKEGDITQEKVVRAYNKIEDPFRKLDYLGRLMGFVGLNLDVSGTFKTEEGLDTLLLRLQTKAVKDAKDVAEKDGLTGIYNRGSIEKKMNERKPKQIYACLMLDIDHFKNINDTYGHYVGDLVIKNVVQIIQENVRESFVGRYGGEEIYIEINQTDGEGGRIVGERIRKLIQEKLVEYVTRNLKKEEKYELAEKFKDQKLTVSIGVADEQQGKDPYRVREKSDKALYMAKRCGRNRVVVNGENPLTDFSLDQKAIFYFGSILQSLGKKTIKYSDKIQSYASKS